MFALLKQTLTTTTTTDKPAVRTFTPKERQWARVLSEAGYRTTWSLIDWINLNGYMAHRERHVHKVLDQACIRQGATCACYVRKALRLSRRMPRA